MMYDSLSSTLMEEEPKSSEMMLYLGEDGRVFMKQQQSQKTIDDVLDGFKAY